MDEQRAAEQEALMNQQERDWMSCNGGAPVGSRPGSQQGGQSAGFNPQAFSNMNARPFLQQMQDQPMMQSQQAGAGMPSWSADPLDGNEWRYHRLYNQFRPQTVRSAFPYYEDPRMSLGQNVQLHADMPQVDYPSQAAAFLQRRRLEESPSVVSAGNLLGSPDTASAAIAAARNRLAMSAQAQPQVGRPDAMAFGGRPLPAVGVGSGGLTENSTAAILAAAQRARHHITSGGGFGLNAPQQLVQPGSLTEDRWRSLTNRMQLPQPLHIPSIPQTYPSGVPSMLPSQTFSAQATRPSFAGTPPPPNRPSLFPDQPRLSALMAEYNSRMGAPQEMRKSVFGNEFGAPLTHQPNVAAYPMLRHSIAPGVPPSVMPGGVPVGFPMGTVPGKPVGLPGPLMGPFAGSMLGAPRPIMLGPNFPGPPGGLPIGAPGLNPFPMGMPNPQLIRSNSAPPYPLPAPFPQQMPLEQANAFHQPFADMQPAPQSAPQSASAPASAPAPTPGLAPCAAPALPQPQPPHLNPAVDSIAPPHEAPAPAPAPAPAGGHVVKIEEVTQDQQLELSGGELLRRRSSASRGDMQAAAVAVAVAHRRQQSGTATADII